MTITPSADEVDDHGDAGDHRWDGPSHRESRRAVMEVVGGARVVIDHPGPASVALAVSGEIDLVTVGALSDCLLAVVELPGRRELLVDLAEVGFLGAAGIGVLAQAHARATERAMVVRLVAGSRVAHRALDLDAALDPTGAGCLDTGPARPTIPAPRRPVD